MISINTPEVVASYLNKYCFDNIWNTPETEYRQNFILRCLSTIPKSGSIHLGPGMLMLPASGVYYLYEMPKCCLGNLKVDLPNWTKLSLWLDTNPFDFRVTGSNGEWLWRDGIQVIDHPYECSFVLAIEVHMARTILGKTYDFTKMYMSVYVDSDMNPFTELRTECYRPDNATNRQQVYARCQNATVVFINGRESQLTSVADIAPYDYVELIFDKDIVSDFTIDLTVAGQSHIYRSSVTGTFNYIIHIPKADNPDNYLLTHNTCDVFVRPKNIERANLRGLFLHRFNTENSIVQLTHNDFAISERLLNAYMEAIGTTEIELRVVVRKHNKTRRLVRDANYVFMLYQLTDDEILEFLEDAGDQSLPFWTANHLEQSLYNKLMFDNPLYHGTESLAYYMKALGYYNALSIIGKRVIRMSVGPNTARTFAVTIPLALLPTEVSAFVYINGLKLDDTLYTTKRVGQYLKITIDDSVVFSMGTAVVVELFESTVYHGEYFAASANNTTFTFTPKEEYLVYLKLEDEEPRTNIFSKTYGINYSFKDVTDNTDVYTVENLSDGTVNLTVTDNYKDRVLLICSKRYMGRVYKSSFTLDTLDNDRIFTGMLYTTAYKWTDGNEVVTIPLFHNTHMIVYLNKQELVPGIDYSVDTTYTLSGAIAAKAVHITNKEYLLPNSTNNTTGNTLEVYATTDDVFCADNGFIINRSIVSLNALLFWYNELVNLACDGRAINTIEYQNGKLTVPNSVRNGALWYARGIAPTKVADTMREYGSAEDLERCTAVLEYFKKRSEHESILVAIPHSHHIYSVVMNEIITDVVHDRTMLVYDPDYAHMRDQVEEYIKASNVDAALSNNHNDIVCHNAGTSVVIKTYTCDNTVAQGSDRKWVNRASNLMICYNYLLNRWEIKSLLQKSTGVYYYADDPTQGNADPVNLDWSVGNLGVEPTPYLETGSLDLRFIDILPSFKHYDSDIPHYNALEQLKRALLPVDGNRDVYVDAWFFNTNRNV